MSTPDLTIQYREADDRVRAFCDAVVKSRYTPGSFLDRCNHREDEFGLDVYNRINMKHAPKWARVYPCATFRLTPWHVNAVISDMIEVCTRGYEKDLDKKDWSIVRATYNKMIESTLLPLVNEFLPPFLDELNFTIGGLKLRGIINGKKMIRMGNSSARYLPKLEIYCYPFPEAGPLPDWRTLESIPEDYYAL